MHYEEKTERASDQMMDRQNAQDKKSHSMQWGRDTTKHEKPIPIGVKQWTIDPILGHVIKAENNDTIVKHFDHFNNTDGYNGEYSYLANLASPRLSRIYLHRGTSLPFLYLEPITFGIDQLEDFRFTNTLSPITNLAYHTCGSKENGEERLRAYFASSIDKTAGIGFKLDYLYGRGYHINSQTSLFNGNLFGYYLGDRYQMHAWIQAGHYKKAENGGIEDDEYIYNPQSFPQKYTSVEIPVNLDRTFNRNDYQTYHLTHRYNLGRYHEKEIPDSLMPKVPNNDELLAQLHLEDSVKSAIKADSIMLAMTLDSLKTEWYNSLVHPKEFVSASSIIHTIRIDQLNHFHYGYNAGDGYFTNVYFGGDGKNRDKTQCLKIRNTLGLAMNEGFRRWMKLGISVYGAHIYERYFMPSLNTEGKLGREHFTYNDINVGGQIDKMQGQLLHYKVGGELTVLGSRVGSFNVDGMGDINIPIRRDTLMIAAQAFIRNEHASPLLEHLHQQTIWWDQSLSTQKRMRVEGAIATKNALGSKRINSTTRLNVGFENIAKYTYLSMQNTLHEGADASSIKPTDYSHSVRVLQAGKNIQVFSATLGQDFKFGPIVWENEITYQTCSNQDVLPLPMINAYSNLTLNFRIARVLRVELGGDVRYFTKYYAPDYAADLGQFAIQDAKNPRIKIGNYPIVNAFLNLHIKRCRIYVAVNHLNAAHGRMFLAPHYPINPMTIHWGVSWNFFN